MTITDQIKILDKKILQNEAQYNLDRKAAKISAYSSKNLDKYEYFTGKDLGLKPNTIEQAKFEYFPLGKIVNKGLDKDDQKEGLFKRLRNIENAQKNSIRDDDNESIYHTPKSEFENQNAKDLMDEIEDADDDIDDYKLLFIGSNKEKFNFNTFRKRLNFISAI